MQAGQASAHSAADEPLRRRECKRVRTCRDATVHYTKIVSEIVVGGRRENPRLSIKQVGMKREVCLERVVNID